MREKIARAIHGDGAGMPFEEIKYARLDQADAALDALMEPDEEMIEVGAVYRGCGCNDCGERAVEMWQAMLTAARSGG